MERFPRYSRATQPQSLTSSKQIKSGYEPSDVETDWQDTPQRELPGERNGAFVSDISRNRSPMKINLNNTAQKSSPTRRRHNSKSPYKPWRDDGNIPVSISNRKNISPFSKSERIRQISPYKSGREEENLDNNEIIGSNRKQNNRSATREERGNHSQFLEVSRSSEKSNFSRRSLTAPRQRGRENDQQNMHVRIEKRVERTPSPLSRNKVPKQREASHAKAPSVGELNEMVANVKIESGPITNDPFLESTDSISPGDIFFSRDVTALAMQKIVLPKNGGFESHFSPKPPIFSSASHQQVSTNGNFDPNARGSSSSAGLSQTTMTSSSGRSRKSNSKHGGEISKISDASGSSVTLQKFTANRRKSQTDAWFACMRKASCRTKSPKREEFDEVAYIEKAFVVEKLRQFWADKYQPVSLNGFTCHKQEAQLLKQIASQDKCPHILLKGPSGSGKRPLAMAFLHEIYGDPCWNITHELRYFQVPEKSSMQVFVPLTSSAHHVEVNVNLEPNAKYALMGIVKEINNNYAIPPEVSVVNFKADFKVIVLYEVDKAAEHVQHLIKWIMDCYTDTCKLILCCEDDVDILESVKNRCKVLNVDAPVTHEIMEVLIQIARKEDFDLPMSFAAKIATKSKQNLRKAIMALEACKAHNYPFVDDQPIPFGWEEALVELAAEILADPSQKRLFFIRGKFQKLLVNFVHPKLILQKLVEHFLKGVDASIKRELYYWHAYYDKRLPTGTTALLKLEEFVAKFMSIYRRSSGNSQYML